MEKTVYDVMINVKSAVMHVLAEDAEQAFIIAKQYTDRWYDEWYRENMDYIDDEPEVVSCSPNIYLDKEEDEPLYGSKKYKTLGAYMDSDEEDEEEFADPRQYEMKFE